MASDLAAADAVLKIGYGDIHEQLDDFVVALKGVESGAKHVNSTNYRAEFAIRTGRSYGIGARNEMDNLPAAGQHQNERAGFFLKYHYGTIQATAQVFEQVRTNTAAFINWVDTEMKDIKSTLQRDLNRQVYGDSTGTLALVATAATAATTIVVDSVHWLEEGMYIDVLTAATLTNPVPTSALVSGTIATITNIDETTNTITITGATVTAAVGSAIVLGSYVDATRTNNWNKEWIGLANIVDDTSELHEIDPATVPVWKPGYIEASVGTLAELDLTHVAQAIARKGTKVTDFLTTYGVANAYWNTLQGLRRFDGGTNLQGGAAMPIFQGATGPVPFTLDWACPPGTLYALNKQEMFLHQIQDWKWEDRTGSMWQQVPNKHAFKAFMYKFSNLGVFRRNAFGKLTGITEL